MAVGATKAPKRKITGVYVHDPRFVGRWRAIAQQTEPPELASATVSFMRRRGRLPRHLASLPGCGATIYEAAGGCWGAGDFNYGWRDWVKIYSFGVAPSAETGGGAFDADERVEDKVEFVFEHVYFAGGLTLQETASATVYSEIVDVAYAAPIRCPGCAASSAETLWIYALMAGTVASPGQPPSVVYTVDGGKNWVDADLGIGSDAAVTFIDMSGHRLMVGFLDGYVRYATVDSKTGVPGAWATVSAGFVAGSGPRDAYVNGREIWLCGDGGYIYHTDDITAGVDSAESGGVTSSDLYRIHGSGNAIVAGGQGGAVICSLDGGLSWTTPTDLPSTSADVMAVWVTDEYLWWLGYQDGDGWYSVSMGEAWSSCCFPGPGSVNAVSDIVFVSAEIGWAAVRTPDRAVIYWTMDGGQSWGVGPRRLAELPTVERYSRLAFPRTRNLSVAANHLVVGGLHANGTDGVLILAKSAEM